MEFLKKNWMQIFAPALCVILLAAVLWQNQKFDALKEELASLSEALEQQEMQTGDLRQQVLELQRSAHTGPALVSWSVTPVSVDTARRELTVWVSVTPAEGRDIGVNSVVAHRPGIDPGENEQWPRAYDFEAKSDGTIGHELTLPYEENSAVAFTVIYYENGERYTQEIAAYASMDALLPVRLAENRGEMGYNMSGDGRLYLVHRSVVLADGAVVEEPVFRLVKNGRTVLEAPAETMEKPGTYSGYPYLEELGGLPCTEGDRVELLFACKDQAGLRYEFTLHTWDIVSSWQTEERWPERGGVTVTWPE